jgi:hypothetical protein
MITMGDTNAYPDFDINSGGFLNWMPVTLAQDATLQSCSIYIGATAGQLRVGVFNNGPIVVQTPIFTPVTGWNTQPVGNVRLTAGTYQLAWFPNSNALTNGIVFGGPASFWNGPRTFGAMPSTLPAATGSDAKHWSLYCTLVP